MFEFGVTTLARAEASHSNLSTQSAAAPVAHGTLMSAQELLQHSAHARVLYLNSVRLALVDTESDQNQSGLRYQMSEPKPRSAFESSVEAILRLWFEPMAFANTGSSKCIYAGWVLDLPDSQRYCPHPKICESPHNPNMVQCNPVLFGAGKCVSFGTKATSQCFEKAVKPEDLVRAMQSDDADAAKQEQASWNKYVSDVETMCTNPVRQPSLCKAIQRRVAAIQPLMEAADIKSKSVTAAHDGAAVGDGVVSKPISASSDTLSPARAEDCNVQALLLPLDYLSDSGEWASKRLKPVVELSEAQAMFCRRSTLNNEWLAQQRARLRTHLDQAKSLPQATAATSSFKRNAIEYAEFENRNFETCLLYTERLRQSSEAVPLFQKSVCLKPISISSGVDVDLLRTSLEVRSCDSSKDQAADHTVVLKDLWASNLRSLFNKAHAVSGDQKLLPSAVCEVVDQRCPIDADWVGETCQCRDSRLAYSWTHQRCVRKLEIKEPPKIDLKNTVQQ